MTEASEKTSERAGATGAFAAARSIKEVFDNAEEIGLSDSTETQPEQDLVRDVRGHPQWCMATATSLFENHPDWKGCLRKDLFASRTMVCRSLPGSKEEKSEEVFTPRELLDEDYTQAIIWANRQGFRNPSKDLVRDAMEAVARRKAFDPIVEWLTGLKWDGKPRLETWLERYLNVESTAYTRAVGRCWMISAVARALKPGSKVDSCLVLEGAQGSGKSTALRILAGAQYFGDNLPELSSKDASGYLRGKWIIELAELAVLNKSSFEQTKAFVSRQEERYRPPYGRNEIIEQRRCVFAGTTNANDYLRDPSGSRRFWPVRVNQVEIVSLKRDRELLWAEAVHAYRSNQPWWLDNEITELAAQEQSERSEDDPWVASIVRYCEGREVVACKEILQEALSHTHDRMGRRESLRVAGLLKRLGYDCDGQFSNGEYKGLAR